jgi:hypothetical protein
MYRMLAWRMTGRPIKGLSLSLKRKKRSALLQQLIKEMRRRMRMKIEWAQGEMLVLMKRSLKMGQLGRCRSH